MTKTLLQEFTIITVLINGLWCNILVPKSIAKARMLYSSQKINDCSPL